MRGTWLAVLALVLTACGGADTGAGPRAVPTASNASPETLRERCLSAVPDDAPIQDDRVLGDAGVAIAATEIGPHPASPVAVVFLHQIGSGSCGWARFATRAAEQDVTGLLIDICGYGASECDPEPPIEDQVDLAVEHLRSLGASRVALVGASMGGSLTVQAVAGGADVDAWVDLSGPSAWDGVTSLSVADRVDESGLVVFAPTDGRAEMTRARRLARRTDARFLAVRSGHGWDLVTRPGGGLTDVGEQVLAFVGGG